MVNKYPSLQCVSSNLLGVFLMSHLSLKCSSIFYQFIWAVGLYFPLSWHKRDRDRLHPLYRPACAHPSHSPSTRLVSRHRDLLLKFSIIGSPVLSSRPSIYGIFLFFSRQRADYINPVRIFPSAMCDFHQVENLESDNMIDFSRMNNRLNSFHGSNLAQQVPAERLARAGFYFTGKADRVRCFSCQKTVDNWCTGDTPVERHKEVNICKVKDNKVCIFSFCSALSS